MVSRFDRRTLLAGGAAAAAGVAGSSALGRLGRDRRGATTNGPGRNGVTKPDAEEGRHRWSSGSTPRSRASTPPRPASTRSGVMYARTVFDPLTIVTTSGGWAPYLAESVVPNSSYTSLDRSPCAPTWSSTTARPATARRC